MKKAPNYLGRNGRFLIKTADSKERFPKLKSNSLGNTRFNEFKNCPESDHKSNILFSQ